MTTNDDDHADERKTVLAEDAVAKVSESDEQQRERKGKAKIEFVSDEHQKESDNEKKKEEESDHEENRFLMERRCMTSPSNNGGFKRPKLASFSRTATRREMPSWLDLVIGDMNAHHRSLVFEKTLFLADVDPNHSRLLMPFKSFIRGDDFLTRAERRIIEEEEDFDIDIDNNDMIGVGAILVDPRYEKWGVVFKKYSGNRRLYSLTCGWNDVVKANDLKVGDNILLWSFRCGGTLCFALTMRQSSSSLFL